MQLLRTGQHAHSPIVFFSFFLKTFLILGLTHVFPKFSVNFNKQKANVIHRILSLLKRGI